MQDLQAKLIQDNWITTQQFNLAKQETAKMAKSIWVALVKLGYLTPEDLAIFFAQETGIAYVRISDYEISPEVTSLIDEDFCRENLVIPLFKAEDRLFVAFSNPLDTALVDRLAKLTSFDIEPLISSADSISGALNIYYGPPDKDFVIEKFVMRQAPLRRLSFWRESERLPLEIPVSVKVEDKNVVLHYSAPVEATTRNVSAGGTAVGLHIFLFIPRGTKLLLEFKSVAQPTQIIKAEGEVVYCRMEKGQRYFLGIKFTKIDENSRNQLLKLSQHA
jgi:hypothetical protein